MANNITVSITADVADLTAKRAVLSAELKAASKDLRDFAEQARTSGMTDALRASMLAAGGEVAKTRAEISHLSHELDGGAEHAGNAREAYEALRITQSVLTGDFARAGEEITHLTEHMAAHAGVAKLLEEAMSPAGLAVAGVTAIAVAGVVAAIQYEEAMNRMETAVVGMGAASGQSRERLESLAKEGNGLKLSVGDAENAVTAFANAGVRDAQVIEQLKNTTADFAALTGQKASEAVKELADAMRDPIKGAQDLNEKLSFLDASELEQIRTLVELGEKTRAQAELSGLLKERTDEAAAASGHLQGGLTEVGNAAGDAWRQFGGLTDALSHYIAVAGTFGADAQKRAIDNEVAKGRGHNEALEDEVENEAILDATSADAAPLYAKTPEEKDRSARNQLQGAVKTINTGLAADIALYGEHSAAVVRDREALAEYTRAVSTYRSEVDKKVQSDKLDVQIEEAKRAHNKAAVADLTRQKSLLSQSGVVETDADANALAAGAGAVAGAKGRGGKKPKDDIVQEWRTQLQTQLEDEKNYFADSKSEELAFWTAKLALTKKGTADYRAVHTEVYNLDKALAIQSRDTTIEIERLTDEDIKKSLRERVEVAHEHNAETLAELKSNLEAQKAIRDADARSQEEAIQSKAKYGGPLAEINAAKQIAVINQQKLAQDMADANAEHVLADQALQDDINNATKDAAAHTKAVDAKKLADLQFFNQHKVLADQMVNQAMADAEKIKAAWHSQIDPVVSATGTQIKGLIEGTETWGQALAKIGESVLSMVIDQIEKVVEEWLVAKIMGATGTQSGVQAQAALAGAAGVASMAAAPFPIDMAAPAFGEAMYAAASSFGVASAAGGWDRVPHDQLAAIHKDEMVLPSHVADPVRAMAANFQGGANDNRGGVTINHSPTYHGVDPETAMQESPRDFTRRVEKMKRRGMI